jgi:hypothetical protein
VASVFELSEPYRNYLVSVLPPGPGVCATCWTAVDPGYRLCYPCDRDFGPGETYYQQAKAKKFTWDSCCLTANG